MTIDEDKINKIRTLGALGHTPSQIAVLLKIMHRELDAFLGEFEQPNTKVYQAYHTGKSMSYYNQNAELMKAAEKGDVFAIQALDERRREQDSDDLRRELFGI